VLVITHISQRASTRPPNIREIVSSITHYHSGKLFFAKMPLC
jgi:hypothetical protein